MSKLIEAVHKLQRSSPYGEDGQRGTLLERVNRMVTAERELEEAIRYELSDDEQRRLLGVLIWMHRDPLGNIDGMDETLDEFLEAL